MPSFVWNYFEKVSIENARCSSEGCKKIFKWIKGIAALANHLKNEHNIVEQSSKRNSASKSEEPTPKRQKNLLECFKKSTLEEEISRMVAESNLTFNQVSESKFIRESLALKYPNNIIPKAHETVAALVMKFHEFAQNEVKERLLKLKAMGKKFSSTLDEWTSSGNSRYLNINLHFTVSIDGRTDHINLGLIKIKGKCPADVMVALVILNMNFQDYSV